MSLDGIALFSLPLPLVVDFAAEHMGFTKYSARRQIVTTFLGAVGLGHAFDRYLNHNGDPLFWTMVGSYAGLCAGAVAVHHLRERRAVQQQDLINEANDPLVQGFASRAEMLAYLER